MSKVIITGDSTCDLSPDILKKLNIQTIPLYVNVGDDSFKDGVDITPDTIFQIFEERGILAKTSAIPIYDFQIFFKDLLDQGFEIVHITLGSKFSTTYQCAVSAANLIDSDKISIVDSENLSTGYGHVIMHGGELAMEDLSRTEIVNELKALIPKVNASFIIDTLTYLWKGGRCSSVSALGANLLQLKPCIEVIDGQMKVGKKYRGNLDRCLKSYVDDRLKDLSKINSNRIFITHTLQEDKIAEKVKERIESKNYFKEIIITKAGCTISCHCGPNTLGILYVDQ